jgi:hypothetical protein
MQSGVRPGNTQRRGWLVLYCIVLTEFISAAFDTKIYFSNFTKQPILVRVSTRQGHPPQLEFPS